MGYRFSVAVCDLEISTWALAHPPQCLEHALICKATVRNRRLLPTRAGFRVNVGWRASVEPEVVTMWYLC